MVVCLFFMNACSTSICTWGMQSMALHGSIERVHLDRSCCAGELCMPGMVALQHSRMAFHMSVPSFVVFFLWSSSSISLLLPLVHWTDDGVGWMLCGWHPMILGICRTCCWWNWCLYRWSGLLVHCVWQRQVLLLWWGHCYWGQGDGLVL